MHALAVEDHSEKKLTLESLLDEEEDDGDDGESIDSDASGLQN